jgi:hypothetical protein
VRELALPGVLAALMSVIRVEGRPFHLAARAVVLYGLSSRCTDGLRPCGPAGGRWHPADIVVLPDGSDSRMRRLRYSGPGAVLIAVEHERAGRVNERAATGVAQWGSRRVVRVRERERARTLTDGEVICLGRRARLRVDAGAIDRGHGR